MAFWAAADVGVTKGVEGEISIDKDVAINYGTMIGVSSIIDNNEGSVPNFGTQYLFKGDYQGTKGGNAYGIYTEGDKHYFDGNVGIGTTSPTGKFNSYISATRQITHNGNGGDLSIISDNNSSPVMFIKGTGSADLLNVFDNTTEVFTILDGGNVGIGTDSPSRELDVENSADNAIISAVSSTTHIAGLVLGDTADDDKGGILYNNTSDYLYFLSNGSERMRIDSAGSMTITTDGVVDATTLTLTQTGGIAIDEALGYLNFYSNDPSTSSTGGVGGIAVRAETTFNTSYTPSYMSFYTHDTSANDGTTKGNVTERMRITSTGHLQVSTGYFELTSQPTTKLWLSTNQVQLYAGNLLVFGGYNALNDSVIIGNESGDVNITLAGGANDKV
jgi:hypothetical protein